MTKQEILEALHEAAVDADETARYHGGREGYTELASAVVDILRKCNVNNEWDVYK